MSTNFEGFKVQGQIQGTQDGTQTFSRDVQLIRKEVEGKIIRICYDGIYHVWTDVGSKRWFLYYRIRVIDGETELQDLMQVGCLDEELLVEPPEHPYLRSNASGLFRRGIIG